MNFFRPKKQGYKKLLKQEGKIGIYNSWTGMKQRCYNSNHPKYKRYGLRGITVCEEWLDIGVFVEWAIKNGWECGKQLDRINNDGNYEPSNCHWVSVSENSRHKSTTKIDMITAQEIRERINEDWYALAKEYNCSHGNIWFIMKNFTHLPKENECAKRLKEYKKRKQLCKGN